MKWHLQQQKSSPWTPAVQANIGKDYKMYTNNVVEQYENQIPTKQLDKVNSLWEIFIGSDTI